MSESAPQWLGLLRWSLQYSDGTSQSSFNESSRENIAWLEKVMSELTVDEPKKIQDMLKDFTSKIDSGIESKDEDIINQQLEELTDLVENIDLALIFVKFGGIQVLSKFLDAENLSPECKILVSSTIGTLAQNCLKVQDEMFQQNLLPKLATYCLKKDIVPNLCAKLTFAMSCMIRGHQIGENAYCSQEFAPVHLNHLLDTNHLPCQKRALFLSDALVCSDFTSPERCQLIYNSLFPRSYAYINHDDLDMRENVYRLITSLLVRLNVHDLPSEHINELKSQLVARQKSGQCSDEENEAITNIFTLVNRK